MTNKTKSFDDIMLSIYKEVVMNNDITYPAQRRVKLLILKPEFCITLGSVKCKKFISFDKLLDCVMHNNTTIRVTAIKLSDVTYNIEPVHVHESDMILYLESMTDVAMFND